VEWIGTWLDQRWFDVAAEGNFSVLLGGDLVSGQPSDHAWVVGGAQRLPEAVPSQMKKKT